MERPVGKLGTGGAEEGSAAQAVAPLSLTERLSAEIAGLKELDLEGLRKRWRKLFRAAAPPHLPKYLLFRVLAYRIQANALGDLDRESVRVLDALAWERAAPCPATRVPRLLHRSRQCRTGVGSSPAPSWCGNMPACCTGSWSWRMASPGRERPSAACRKQPRPSPAPTGMVRVSLASAQNAGRWPLFRGVRRGEHRMKRTSCHSRRVGITDSLLMRA